MLCEEEELALDDALLLALDDADCDALELAVELALLEADAEAEDDAEALELTL